MKDYLVQTHATSQPIYKQFLANLGVKVWEDYSEFPTLYLVHASPEQIEAIKSNKETKMVETANRHANKFSDVDEVGNIIESGEMDELGGTFAVGKQNLTTYDNWGLGRIDERGKDEPNVYRYEKTGAGVDAYIIDSGVFEHSDLTGRVVNLWTGFTIFDDEDGHGTHVASTVAGKRYGVAKNATIYNVKVFDASVSAPISLIASGCNAALKHHRDKIAQGVNRPSVVNMSLGGNGSLLNVVVAEMQKAGMVICVAAGNESGDLDRTIDVYPAESPNVITVNSVNKTDRPSTFNNYGSACDAFAPGEAIKAAGIQSTTWWSQMSGTSMASPHWAGVCALALEGQPIFTTKAEVEQFYAFVLGASTLDRVIFDGVWSGFDSRFVNKIAYSLLEKDEAADVAEPVVPAPVITPPVIAPSPVPVAPLPTPPKKESGNKNLIYIGIGVVVVIGIIIALAV